MVRHKTRWLLVKFQFKCNKDPTAAALDKKDVYKELAMSMSLCYGLSAHSMISEVMVRHVVDGNLAMIRVPREIAAHVRTAIVYMTSINSQPVVPTVVAVNGCARTAKLAAMKETRKRAPRDGLDSANRLRELDSRLQIIREID
jgi:RNase P/RNase MRP subunit POP5